MLGSADKTLDLLRLALLRSDAVVAVASDPDFAARRFTAQFAIELYDRAPQPRDFDDVTAALIALDDESENVLVREAWRRGVPVHVMGRPLVSDFSRLDLVAQRRLSILAAASRKARSWISCTA